MAVKNSSVAGLMVISALLVGVAGTRFALGEAKLANDVVIYRDHSGTPHVFGKTDASTVFGFAYAQGEDNFAPMEDDFILAIGRASVMLRV